MEHGQHESFLGPVFVSGRMAPDGPRASAILTQPPTAIVAYAIQHGYGELVVEGGEDNFKRPTVGHQDLIYGRLDDRQPSLGASQT